jgi:hypothetical protein
MEVLATFPLSMMRRRQRRHGHDTAFSSNLRDGLQLDLRRLGIHEYTTKVDALVSHDLPLAKNQGISLGGMTVSSSVACIYEF